MVSIKHLIAALVVLFATAFTAEAQDKATVVQRVRTELGTLLKKDPASLTVDKPVTELGADDLTVVEWIMALDKAFQIRLPDDKAIDPKTKKTRKDLTIDSMATTVIHTLADPKRRR